MLQVLHDMYSKHRVIPRKNLFSLFSENFFIFVKEKQIFLSNVQQKRNLLKTETQKKTHKYTHAPTNANKQK